MDNKYVRGAIHILALAFNILVMVLTDQSPRVLLYSAIIAAYYRLPTIWYAATYLHETPTSSWLVGRTRRPNQYDDGSPMRVGKDNRAAELNHYLWFNTATLIFLMVVLAILQGNLAFLHPEVLIAELVLAMLLALIFLSDDLFSGQLILDPHTRIHRNLAYNSTGVFILMIATLFSMFGMGWGFFFGDLFADDPDQPDWSGWLVLIVFFAIKLSQQLYIDFQDDRPRAVGGFSKLSKTEKSRKQ